MFPCVIALTKNLFTNNHCTCAETKYTRLYTRLIYSSGRTKSYDDDEMSQLISCNRLLTQSHMPLSKVHGGKFHLIEKQKYVGHLSTLARRANL